jgi:quinoprotein glucose dehydrogenase
MGELRRCVVCKNRRIGVGFQLVHHDMWDYDTAAQPVAYTLRRGGVETPVVIQKQDGNLFVLNRETEFRFRRRGTRGSRVTPKAGSLADAALPIAPPALVAQSLTAKDAWGINPEERRGLS